MLDLKKLRETPEAFKAGVAALKHFGSAASPQPRSTYA